MRFRIGAWARELRCPNGRRSVRIWTDRPGTSSEWIGNDETKIKSEKTNRISELNHNRAAIQNAKQGYVFLFCENFSLDNHALIWESKWQKRRPETGRSRASPSESGDPNTPERWPAIGIEIRSVLAAQNRIKLTKKRLDLR